jgi:hypothetical protein
MRLRPDEVINSQDSRGGENFFDEQQQQQRKESKMTLRTLNLEQIEELAHGESIPRFSGKIRKVWDQKTGDGEYGPWYIQNLVVALDDGEITVTWTGEDEFEYKQWIGKLVAFECGTNKQGRLVGVVRDIRTAKDGTVYKGVKVTAAGKVRLLAESGLPEEKADKEPPTGAPERAQGAPKGTGEPQLTGDEKVEACARQARRIFFAAWTEAEEAIEWLIGKDAKGDLTVYQRCDLQLRIAQGIAIEVNKVIRKERF